MDNGGPQTTTESIQEIVNRLSMLERENRIFKERNNILEAELSRLQNYLEELKLNI